MVRAGEVSPTELVRLSLDRIARLDPQLNAFRKVVFAERALLEAEQAEARLRRVRSAPCSGCRSRSRTRSTSPARSTRTGPTPSPSRPRHDSEMVRRLREAGAIVVGLTLMPELGICGFTESATYGVTRNPWNPQRSPGGSSGGSAAAVASGMVPIASAGDGGGSIRDPRGLLRAVRDQASARPDLAGSGPRELERPRRRRHVSRTVLDGALWLDICSGGSEEPGAPPPPERPFVDAANAPPGKLRIAWSTAPPRVGGAAIGIRGRQGGRRRYRRAARLARS